MSDPNKQLVPEDRVISALETVRLKAVELICEIDKQIDYIEHCKEIDPIAKRKLLKLC